MLQLPVAAEQAPQNVVAEYDLSFLTVLWIDQNVWMVFLLVSLGVCLRLGRQNTTDWVTLEKYISLRFWRPEVPNQGAGRVGFWQSLSPWLIDGHLLTVSSCT